MHSPNAAPPGWGPRQPPHWGPSSREGAPEGSGSRRGWRSHLRPRRGPRGWDLTPPVCSSGRWKPRGARGDQVGKGRRGREGGKERQAKEKTPTSKSSHSRMMATSWSPVWVERRGVCAAGQGQLANHCKEKKKRYKSTQAKKDTAQECRCNESAPVK